MSTAVPEISLRAPRLSDGKAVHELIAANPPLDLNSSYNYFLLCSHFADTCAIGEAGGRAACFLSAYRLPRDPQTLFVWQMAVDGSLRGMGMAGRMIEHVLGRPACEGVRFIETTVSPSNRPSRRVFERLAAGRATALRESVFLRSEDFGTEDHEEEVLFRIGPLN